MPSLRDSETDRTIPWPPEGGRASRWQRASTLTAGEGNDEAVTHLSPPAGKTAGDAGAAIGLRLPRTPDPRLASLRAALSRLDEGCGNQGAPREARPSGIPALDAALGGGLPAGGLVELHLDETRLAGAGAGFVLALAALYGATPARPLLWAGPEAAFAEAGLPYLPGAAAFGLDPQSLVLARTRRLEEAVWVGEEGARSGVPSLVVLEVRGNPALLGLEGTRRLHLRAQGAGVPLLLLRQAARAEPTAAPWRLRLCPLAAAPPERFAETRAILGAPAFDLLVEKTRTARPRRFALEWNAHEHRLRPLALDGTALPRPRAAEAFDGPGAAGAARPRLADGRAA